MGTQSDILRVSGTINDIPSSQYDTTLLISPEDFVVTKLEIKKVKRNQDEVINPVNGQIEINYGEEYLVNVMEYAHTTNNNTYTTKDNSDTEFHWYLEYEEYETTKFVTTPLQTGKTFKFKPEKYYMANEKFRLHVKLKGYDTIFTFEMKMVFKFEFDRKQLVKDVIARKKEPHKLRQPSTLCGIAAPCYIWAKHHPDEYAETVLELHARGKVNINDLKIEPGDHLFKLKTSKKPGYSSIADWVLMASIRDSENTFLKFGDSDKELTKGLTGFTLMSTVKELIEKMCKYKIIDEDSRLLNKIIGIRWSVSKVKNYIDKINNYYINDNYETLMMIDSDLIDDIKNYDSVDFHWIVYQGNLTKTDDNAKFDVYSWGTINKYKINDSYERIRRNWYQYLVIKCMK